MTREILVQFVKFQAKASVREYVFTVKEASGDPREFTLAISNEAFNARRVRYQDGPDVCSAKLRQELAAYGNYPPDTHYLITDVDLEDYRTSHAPRSARQSFGKLREER